MSFNLGAFAGAAAQSGMNTYQTLEAIESQKKRDALIDAQIKEQEALKAASAETYGQVGAPETALPGRKLTEAEVGNAYAIDQGDAAAVAPKLYSKEQAQQDYAKRLYAINPDRAMQTELTGSQLKRVKAEDDFSSWMQKSQAQIAEDPVKFVQEHLAEYNKAKQGSHLDDKLTGSVVSGGAPGVYSFVQTDAKGKVVGSTPINATTAQEALKNIAFSRYASLPGKFKESAELGFKKEEVGLKGRELDIKEPYYKAEANKANAQASALGAADSERRKTSSPAYQKMLEQGNALTDQLNNTTDPQQRVALQRQLDTHQVKIANYLGKTLMPKERANPNELAPVKDNPGMFVASNGIYYRQDGDAFTPIMTPALAAKVKQEAQAVKAEQEQVKKRTKALTPPSGGSHAPVDSWKPATTAPGISTDARAELADINRRLQFVGISPETEASLLLRKQTLLGGGMGNRLLNARGID